jgi:hypothetical protein
MPARRTESAMDQPYVDEWPLFDEALSKFPASEKEGYKMKLNRDEVEHVQRILYNNYPKTFLKTQKEEYHFQKPY